MNRKDSIFVPAKIRHTALTIHCPVNALETYMVTENEYYKGLNAVSITCTETDLRSSSQPAFSLTGLVKILPSFFLFFA